MPIYEYVCINQPITYSYEYDVGKNKYKHTWMA